MSRNNTKEIDDSQSYTEQRLVHDQSFRGIYPLYKKRADTLAVLLDRFREEYSLDSSVKLTYAGRLDPMAEGIVLVLAGEDRFIKDSLLGLDKIYEVEVLLGIATDTQDPLGIITDTNFKDMERKAVEQTIAGMKTLTALPYPLYSSALVKGKPLFVHARAGTRVTLPQKKIKIYDAKLLEIKKVSVAALVRDVMVDIAKVIGDFRQEEITKQWQTMLDEQTEITVIKIRVHASSGTYMRSLAAWMGEQLHIPALAYRINRIQIGEYKNE